MDKVRVLRIIEYVGDRDVVERVVAASIHGSKVVGGVYAKGELTIRAATIGTYPEILDQPSKQEQPDAER